MKISYYKDGKYHITSSGNEDIDIYGSLKDNRYTYSIIAKSDIVLESAFDEIDCRVYVDDIYFMNGYQSWTDSKEVHLVDLEINIEHRPKAIVEKFAMDKYGDATFYDYSINKLHGYDLMYKKGKEEFFIYNMNYDVAYLIIEVVKTRRLLNLISDVKGQELKVGDNFKVFDYYYFGNYNNGLESYKKTFPSLNKEKIFGYTSWYNYYTNINEEIIIRDLDALDDKFQLFQIDDGYETYVGDWLNVDKEKFPNGLKPIVDKIHNKGLKAGIWLAPFVAEEDSELFKNHKEWFKTNNDGKLEKSGGNWSGFYALDFDHEGVIEYLNKCLNYYVNLGFDFFKLDFLYASALYEYKGRTRCIVQNKAYKWLRDVLGDKIILGCGAHMANGIGKFDYMRIGPDVSLKFDDNWYMKAFHRERVSTKNTLQNTVFRSLFNDRLFGNDPDVFLLRDDNIFLSNKQKESLSTINALFGNILMTSDNISTYDDEKKKALEKTLNIFKNAKVLDYKLLKSNIKFSYELDGEIYTVVYNTSKGTMKYER